MIELHAAHIGAAAQVILAAGEPASVIGLTSRGIFIATSTGQVVFLSFETWRGPLTINLIDSNTAGDEQPRHRPFFGKTLPPFDAVAQNHPVSLKVGELVFKQEGIRVSTSHLSDWLSTRTPISSDHLPDIQNRFRKVAQLVQQASQGKGWSSLLEHWSNPEGAIAAAYFDISGVEWAFNSGDVEAALAQAAMLLGRGSGLTPSGDDVITGLLLGMSRFHPEILSGFQSDFISRLLPVAREKTTWLAAGLIACAAEGQVDERLATGMDGIILGNLPPEEISRRLLAYGSSSGADALIGMGISLDILSF
jgi:hypothetical protein